MSFHSKKSPSKAHRYLRCTASLAEEAKYPDVSSPYAQEGTAAHALAAECMLQNISPVLFIGKEFAFDDHGESKTITVTEEMARHIDGYVNYLREEAGDDPIEIEKRFDLSHILGDGESGTTDACIPRVNGSELVVGDLKYGQGTLYTAKWNEQEMIYALGALKEYEILGTFERVKLVIRMPRKVDSEWTISVDELLKWGESVKQIAQDIDAGNVSFVPGEIQCKFCKVAANGACKALDDYLASAVDFDDLDVSEKTPDQELADKAEKIPLIELWIKGVASALNSRVLSGSFTDNRFKAVEGKKGNRAWANEDEAEQQLKAFRLKNSDMYTQKVISPTQAEKVLKDNPRRWTKMLPLISRKEAGLTVVPASDPRPPVVIPKDEFDDLEADNGQLES